MSDKLMDTVPGGETPQYESIKTVTNPTDAEAGQLGGNAAGTSEHEQQKHEQQKHEKGEKIAENVRYGQNISESGVGGKTTTSESNANQGGFGGAEAQKDEANAAHARRIQGYGPGSGVGA